MNDVEKQVSVCHCVRGLFLSSMSLLKVQLSSLVKISHVCFGVGPTCSYFSTLAILIESWEIFSRPQLEQTSLTNPNLMLNDSLCCVQVCELQRSLKASQTEQQEALERATSAVTLEQKAIQDSLLQVDLHTHTHTLETVSLFGHFALTSI